MGILDETMAFLMGTNGYLDDSEKIRKFALMKKYRAKSEVEKEVETSTQNLLFEIGSMPSKRLMRLVHERGLEGWCWQTTSFVVPFLEPNAYICRGNLVWSGESYYHSWLCFSYENQKYVFDPCFDFLCLQEIYDGTFTTEVLAKISQVKVKEQLLTCLTGKTPAFVPYSDSVEDPFYRTTAHVEGKVEGEKILSLKAHYYYNG